MTRTALAAVDLTGFRLGPPQRAGRLTMVPVLGAGYPGVSSPVGGVKLARVETYGTVVLTNPARDGVAIVPLHLGYVQDGAQNHALCRSAFLAPGEELRFDDACCVQAAQGGYLVERDQWFFVLPAHLRAAALDRRGERNYSKLWDDITALNRRFGLPARGHLEQLLGRRRATLTRYRTRLELNDGQLGALFFLDTTLIGVEIGPDAAYFADVWPALVCFCYGPAALLGGEPDPPEGPYEVSTVDELADLRNATVAARAAEVEDWLAATRWVPSKVTREDRYRRLTLSTVDGAAMAGQVVTDGGRTVYASVTARQID